MKAKCVGGLSEVPMVQLDFEFDGTGLNGEIDTRTVQRLFSIPEGIHNYSL